MADDYFEELIRADRTAAAQELFPQAARRDTGLGTRLDLHLRARDLLHARPAPLPPAFSWESASQSGHGPRQSERGVIKHGCATPRAHSRLPLFLFAVAGTTIPLRRASRAQGGGQHLLALSYYLDVKPPRATSASPACATLIHQSFAQA